jgi:hypothetical protein
MQNRSHSLALERFAVAVFALSASLTFAHAVEEAKPSAQIETSPDRIVLTNGRLELTIDVKSGINPCRLVDKKSGRVYADTDYFWCNGARPALLEEPSISEKNGTRSATLKGKIGDLEIEQTFIAPADEPNVITEVIRLRNPSEKIFELPAFACGFAKNVHDGKEYKSDVAQSHFCDVPYRRHPETGELCDFTIQDISEKKWWYSTVRSQIYDRKESIIRGAEAWAWHDKDNTLLITKYNPDSMEWSLVEVTPKDMGKVLRFGGAGRWKLGDPEGAARLAPGATFTFGETRYQVLDGDWREGYKAFRKFTASKGHVTPPNFNPPVHWNELYDNPYIWREIWDTAENRNKFYQFKDMEIEAEKAKEMSCECLYLDPGWDTSFSSNIWGDDRLGKQEDFVRWLKDKYNFKLALHTPLAPWTNPESYPAELLRMDKAGNRMGELCTSSPAYIETKVARLKELCKKGAYFLMYDGSWFPGECWDKTHGHSLPVTHQEHVDAILKIQQKLHEAYPNVLIEQHDPMTGPGTPRYVPTYFMHAKPGAFDELWGFEYMVEPMDDIITRRAFSLYYVNLAYGIPVYLHIDLRKDNANAMMLWWYASTCRHLGFGGKSADPAVWETQKNAMKTYMKLKRFFTQGVFYGLDETIHVHTLPDAKQAIVNVFNLEEQPATKEICFRLTEIGLPALPVEIEGATFEQKGDEITLKADVSARSHSLVKINIRDGE